MDMFATSFRLRIVTSSIRDQYNIYIYISPGKDPWRNSHVLVHHGPTTSRGEITPSYPPNVLLMLQKSCESSGMRFCNAEKWPWLDGGFKYFLFSSLYMGK